MTWPGVQTGHSGVPRQKAVASPSSCPSTPSGATLPLTRLALNLRPQAWILGLFKGMITFRSVLPAGMHDPGTDAALILGASSPAPLCLRLPWGYCQACARGPPPLPPGSSSSPGPWTGHPQSPGRACLPDSQVSVCQHHKTALCGHVVSG